VEVLPELPFAALLRALESIPPLLYYSLLFICFVAEGTSFPLVHIPAIVMFLASAHLVASGQVSLAVVILVSAAGATLGAFLTHLVGVRMALNASDPKAASSDRKAAVAGEAPAPGSRLLGVSPEQVDRVWAWLERYGALVAAAARWLGVLRPPILLGTGIARMSPWKVLPALAVGALSYCAFYQLVALEIRAVSFALLRSLEPEVVLLTVAGLAVAWAAAIFLLRRVRS